MLYSGYEPEELDSVQQECVDNSDIVILGRYKEELRNTKLRWRGSENQVLYSPTGRYTVEDFPDGETEISVHIDADGKLLITGYPDLEFMMEIMDKITGSYCKIIKRSEQNLIFETKALFYWKWILNAQLWFEPSKHLYS